jgi:excisionase family DNA binding protein
MSQIDPSHGEHLVDARAAAERLNISRRSLWSLTNSGQIGCIRIGRCVRYRLEDLKAFVDANRQGGEQ